MMNSGLATRLNTQALLIATALTALTALVLGFVLSGVLLGALLSLALIALWLRGWRHIQLGDAFVDIGLIAAFTLAVAGTLVLAPALLMELAGAAALLCWSFMRFELRTKAVKRVDQAEAMAAQHTRWALVAGAVGLALAGLAVLVRTNFTFAAIFFLGLLAVLLLSNILSRWRGEK
jgi:hypothetical protein